MTGLPLLRPVRYFKGVPSPVGEPEKTDMVILRENSADIYAGIEFGDYTSDALAAELGGIGIAPGCEPVGLGGDVRGHARHGAEVRRQGLREPRLRDPVGADEAATHGLDRSGRSDHRVDAARHPEQAGHQRFRAACKAPRR